MKPITIITDKEIKSMSEAVNIVIDALPSGYRFHGYDLKTLVTRIYPKARRMYPDTILRAMRKTRHFHYNTIDAKKSLYEKR